MTYRALTQDSDLPSCMHFPRFLNGIPCSSSSKLLYCILLDATLTRGLKDEHGQTYVCFSIPELNRYLLRGESTTKRLLHELEEYGLLMRRRKHNGNPSRLYVLIPAEDKQSGFGLRGDLNKYSAYA